MAGPAQPHDPAEGIAALCAGRHGDPFSLLGMHPSPEGLWVRAFLPGAHSVSVIERRSGRRLVELVRRHADGFFSATVPRRRNAFDYRLRVQWRSGSEEDGQHGSGAAGPGTETELDDPYAYGTLLGETDVWLLAEGTHLRPYERLGAHPTAFGEVSGTMFSVWAPNASRVAVVGDFNDWDERRHPMRLRAPAGIWELFLPGVAPGRLYKFSLLDRQGNPLPLHSDPYARRAELRPATASVVAPALRPLASAPTGTLAAEPAGTSSGEAAATSGESPRRNAVDRPISIYEVHAGSWRRVPHEGNRLLDWDELAAQLIPYVKDLGFTHIELLPVSEHPFDGSWGYQPTALYAPTARHGDPDGLRRFVQASHQAGLGVLLDWVPGHFPGDEHALARFDGTHLYEHSDPREGLHRDWGTLIYNYGRSEVRNFLIGNARYWVEQFGVDGVRVDAVASMLYRDYSRQPGEWIPNQHGGRENIEAIAFLRELNEKLGASHPEAATIAEESTAWPGVSRPTSTGGLGFHYKWNMGWMNDTLRYMGRDPAYRRYHQNELTFGMVYAYDENFVLPLSHDEVVHGKGSLVARMPGDTWQKLANLRAYFAFMFAHPGKKLLFMGGEFAQWREWDHDSSLDWHLLEDAGHRGVQSLVRDLNYLYRDLPALHRRDCEPGGFEWISHDDHHHSVLSFLRLGSQPDELVMVVCNFTPVPREDYRVGVPRAGRWRECLNSDSVHYGGSNVGNEGMLQSQPAPAHGRADSLSLTLPPLGVLYLIWTE